MSIFYYGACFISFLYAISAFLFRYFPVIGYDSKPINLGLFLLALASYSASRVKREHRTLYLIGTVVAMLLPFAWDRHFCFFMQWAMAAAILVVFEVNQIRPYNYKAVKNMYCKMAYIFLIIPLIQWVGPDNANLTAINSVIPYLILYLVTGVLLLRSIRFREDPVNQRKFERQHLLQTAGYLVVCALLTASELIQFLLKCVYMYIIRPIIAFVAIIMAKILSVEITIPEKETETTTLVEVITEEEVTVPLPEGGIAKMLEDARAAVDAYEPKDENWYILAMVIIGVFVAVILVFILSNKKNRGRKASNYEGEEIEESSGNADSGKAVVLTRNELVIRKQYRQFMQQVNCETSLADSDTCDEINGKYSEKNELARDSSSELTMIYKRARYSDKPVNKEDVKLAKNLYKSIKNN